MILLAIIIVTCITTLIFTIIMIWVVYFASRRAYKESPIGYKSGMYINECGELIGTRTAIHRDPISGETFLGKTMDNK